MTEKEEYRALVGMNFKSKHGKERRVEAGDKIQGMPENEIQHQINEGNVEVWKEGDTSNVREDGDVLVHGVRSRHKNAGADIDLHEVEESGDEE